MCEINIDYVSQTNLFAVGDVSHIFLDKKILPKNGNVIKLTESEKEAGVCLYVREQTPAITYTKMA